MNQSQVKTSKSKTSLLPEILRDISAWQGIAGIWKGKKMQNPVAWQKKIRKELERKSL